MACISADGNISGIKRVFVRARDESERKRIISMRSVLSIKFLCGSKYLALNLDEDSSIEGVSLVYDLLSSALIEI